MQVSSHESQVSSLGSLDHQKFPPASQYYASASSSPAGSTDSSPLTPPSIDDDDELGVVSITGMSSAAPPPTKPMITRSPNGSVEISPCSPEDDQLRFGASPDLSNQVNGRRRPKNLKNLAVKTAAGSASLVRPLASATAPGFGLKPPNQPHSPMSSTSAIPVHPQTQTARRRPSNLSVITATSSVSTNASSIGTSTPHHTAAPAILPRPNVLRHFQSSPALPLLDASSPSRKIESAAPLTNHMRPVLERSHSATSPIKEDDFADYDLPLSREEKQEAYPGGPICVYEPHLDLYLEPTAQIASAYDVVINVASEVRNPFVAVAESDAVIEQDLRIDGGGGIQYAPRRDRVPNLRTEPATLTADNPGSRLKETGKDSPLKEPEYIHVPWEHNSDIVPELPGLVRLIDDRIMRGKRVLVHCQCGVSRSATLVVAYRMYKRPSATVQEAYDEVKKRSKWIGPNMNLIMQLQEFRSNLIGKATSRRLTGFRGISPIDRSSPKQWLPQRPVLHIEASYDQTSQPKTAPLQPGLSPQDALGDQLSSAVTPGPSSAPSGVSWPITGDSIACDSPSRTASIPSYQNSSSWDDDDDIAAKPRPQSFRFEGRDELNGSGPDSPATPRSGNVSMSARSAQNFSLPLRRYAEEEQASPTKLASPAKAGRPVEPVGQIADAR